MFKDVSSPDWARFEAASVPHNYRPGDIIFYQGNRPLGLYFICGGRAKLVKDDRIGRSQIVRIVTAPNLLGDRAFFAGTTYACSATVTDRSQICFLEMREFWEIFGRNAAMMSSIAQRFAADLGRAEEYMNCISVCTVIERMAAHLLAAWARSTFAPRHDAEFTLGESRTELAELLGTTPEAVSRALADLRAKQILVIKGRHVRIINEERLRRVACLPVKAR